MPIGTADAQARPYRAVGRIAWVSPIQGSGHERRRLEHPRLWSAPRGPRSRAPAAVLAAYEEARNSNDYDALRELYADDAVITGHPLDTSDPQVADVDEFVALKTQRGNEHPEEATTFANVEVFGDRATFAHLFFASTATAMAAAATSETR